MRIAIEATAYRPWPAPRTRPIHSSGDSATCPRSRLGAEPRARLPEKARTAIDEYSGEAFASRLAPAPDKEEAAKAIKEPHE